jgi:hypothetical protein
MVYDSKRCVNYTIAEITTDVSERHHRLQDDCSMQGLQSANLSIVETTLYLAWFIFKLFPHLMG